VVATDACAIRRHKTAHLIFELLEGAEVMHPALLVEFLAAEPHPLVFANDLLDKSRR
jgi:hypothetical protein